MPSLQRMEKLYRKNVEFFAKNNPTIAEDLAGQEGVGIDIRNENKDVLFKVGKQEFSYNTLRKECEAQLANLGTQMRPVFGAKLSGLGTIMTLVDDIDSGLMADDIFIAGIDNKYRKRIWTLIHETVAAKARVSGMPDFGERYIPILIVFGSGIGWHLEQLVRNWTIDHLIVVDTDVSFTKLSFCFIDYEKLIAEQTKRNGIFTLLPSDDPEKVSRILSATILGAWPPFFVYGMPKFYHLHDRAAVMRITEKLEENCWMMSFGWGFFDDEMLSWRHSICNAATPMSLFSKPDTVPEYGLAVIVGAGPSLDAQIPLIRQLRDKAVIVSGGSALRPLLVAGITPDYHVEIERTEITTDSLVVDPAIVPRLKDITLIGLPMLPPATVQLFGKVHYMLRFADTGAEAIVGDGGVFVSNNGPTVVNGATAFCAAAGFKFMCLMGADFGYADEAEHHAKDSLYFLDNEDGSLERLTKGNDAQISASKGARVAGNLVSHVYTNAFLLAAKNILESVFRNAPDILAFNSCNGAKIEGTIPVPIETLESRLATLPFSDKASVLEAIEASFTMRSTSAEKACATIKDGFSSRHATLAQALERPIQGKEDYARLLREVCQMAGQLVGSTPGAVLLRSSLYHLSKPCYDFGLRLGEDESFRQFAQQSIDLINDFIKEASELVASLDPADPLSPPQKKAS